MTHLRKLMLDELQRRNYSQNTVRAYIHAVEDFSRYFHRSPDCLGAQHIREYQVHLFRDCKLSPGTIEGRTAALRFLFVKTLRRPYLPDHIPFPKRQRRLPTVLSQEDVARLIASAQNLMHRTMLMMLLPARRAAQPRSQTTSLYASLSPRFFKTTRPQPLSNRPRTRSRSSTLSSRTIRVSSTVRMHARHTNYRKRRGGRERHNARIKGPPEGAPYEDWR